MSWAFPSASLAVPPLLLTVQSTLCQYSQTDPLRLVRLLLLPIALYGTWTCMHTYFEPKRDFVIFNVIIQISRAWACFRSVELATASQQYRWIGYAAAYDDAKARSEHTHCSPNLGRAIMDGWSNLCSLRGIGWSWGLTGAQIPPQHRPSSALWSIVRLYSWSQALSAATLAVIILARRAGGPAHWAGDLTGLQQTALLGQVANAINVAAVGAVIFSSIECGYSALSLAAWLLINILRTILPPSVAPLPFDARGWPRLMQHPQRSTSLHEFWGKRWHALFKRIFVHDGSKTLSRLARGVGAGKLFTSAAAVMGAFIVSGWMHESFNYATPWTPRDANYDTFRFFAYQPLGIIAESLFTSLTGKRVKGPLGFLWTFAFLLSTGRLMADCWLERGIADYAPHPATWEWWRWILPFGFIFPRLS